MSQLLVDDIVNKDGTGSPGFSKGAVVTGVATATTFKGALTGDVTGNISGATGDFTGNVSIGGTLTYEDVTNIDSVGVVTARKGVLIPDGSATDTRLGIGNDQDLALYHNGSNSFVVDRGTGPLYIRGNNAVRIESYVDDSNGEPMIVANSDGAVEIYYDNSKKIESTPTGAIITGIATVTVGTDLDGFKVEEGTQDGSTALNGEFDYKLENGHVQRYSNATGGNYFPDFKVSSSQSLSSVMDVGDVISVTLIVASSSHYCTTGIKIDDSTSNLDIDWVGGSAPSAANGSGFDLYAFTIMKTAATPAYHIIGNALGVA